MNIKRNVLYKLLEWKKNPKRKPLILRGARQVGKTTIIKEFSKSYKYSIHLNLELNEHRVYFNQFANVETLVEALFFSNNIPSTEKNQTLLFIDEIQESAEAISMLRYFYEKEPLLNVVAAGSLLEHVMRKVRSFPVGRVQMLYMYPVNFSEFLLANGQNMAYDQLCKVPIEDFAHPSLLKWFHRYTIIGGMPEVISQYMETNSISDLIPIYQSIWETYKEDVVKYASNDTEARVIKHIINTAHLELDSRIKFQNFGNSNFKSREVGEAFRNLDDAKIIQLIYPTTDTQIPMRADLKKAPRLQYLDTGIINYELNIQSELLSLTDFSDAYRGAIIPHMVTQEIISLNDEKPGKPHFWVREKSQSSSEVDLLFQYQNLLIPIEIKSGKAGKLRSLHQFVEESEHPYAIRLYAGNFNVETHKTPNGKPYFLMNLPYYLSTQLTHYIQYFTSNFSMN
jgi:predicted AAA+ superfamily ATPase